MAAYPDLTGALSYAVGKQFEAFAVKYLIPGAERIKDKEGIGDYVWRNIYIEIKSGKGVETDQLARIAANAAKAGTGFAYIYLNKPSRKVVKQITDAGVLFSIFSERSEYG